VVILSNRGPIEHGFNAKGRVVRRSADGGVATVLSSVVSSLKTTWIASARSEADRQVARSGNALKLGEATRLRLVETPELADELHNEFCNTTLWYLQHGMLDSLHREDLERQAMYAWQLGYMPVNMAFAETLVKEAGPDVEAVMLHDFHLYTAPAFVRSRYPKAFLQHFIHIPWPVASEWSKLPRAIVESICRGLLANDSVVFQTNGDVDNFLATCAEFLPAADIVAGSVSYHGQHTRVWSNPVSIDAALLEKRVGGHEAAAIGSALEPHLGEKTIVRVDRLDPSKNVDTGFEAYDRMLVRHPEWHGRVNFLAFLVPTRTSVEEYRDYKERVMAQVEAINARHGTDGWQPIQVFFEQNRLQALVAMTMYDVLLVNSRADGLNLVSKEGPIVNTREGVLVLSTRAGSYEELHGGAFGIEPTDVIGTAEALYEAITMPAGERHERATKLRRSIIAHQSDDWLAMMLRDMMREVVPASEMSVVAAAPPPVASIAWSAP